MASWKLIAFSSVIVCLCLQNEASSEFNSSQPTPVIRTVEIPTSGYSPYGGGHRFASTPSGKYRSSFYYPKYKKRTTTASPGSTASPVYVVWSRQGAAAPAAAAADQSVDAGYGSSGAGAGASGPGTGYQGMNDYYHYDVHQDKYSDRMFSDKYGDKYADKYDLYYANYPYSTFKQDPYPSESKYTSTGKYLKGRDEDEEEEEEPESFDDGDYDEDNEVEVERNTKRASKKSKTALNKNRRTGIEHLGGLLSLKGLKLSAIGFFYLFRGVIILLWKFLPWIFLVVVAFLFIPVPIITIPAAAGRSIISSVNMTEISGAMTSLAHKVTESEQCVERISCEIRRRSDDTWVPTAVKFLLFNYGSSLPMTLSRMAKSFIDKTPCRYMQCDMITKALE